MKLKIVTPFVFKFVYLGINVMLIFFEKVNIDLFIIDSNI